MSASSDQQIRAPTPQEIIERLKKLEGYKGQLVEIQESQLVEALGPAFTQNFQLGIGYRYIMRPNAGIRKSVLPFLSNQLQYRLECNGRVDETNPNPISFPIKLPVTQEEIEGAVNSGVYGAYMQRYGIEEDRRLDAPKEQ